VAGSCSGQLEEASQQCLGRKTQEVPQGRYRQLQYSGSSQSGCHVQRILPKDQPQQAPGLPLLSVLGFFWWGLFSAASCHIAEPDVALDIRSRDLDAGRTGTFGQNPLSS